MDTPWIRISTEHFFVNKKKCPEKNCSPNSLKNFHLEIAVVVILEKFLKKPHIGYFYTPTY